MECFIPGNVTKHSGECHQIFRVMSSNIPGNVAKHSREYRQTFRGMSSNILGNVAKHSGECRQVFRGISPNIPGNDAKYSAECRQTFWRISSKIPRNNHNGFAFKFRDSVLLNYFLFALDFTKAKKSTKIIVKRLVIKCYYTFCQAITTIYKF